jgi:hypothetical protein
MQYFLRLQPVTLVDVILAYNRLYSEQLYHPAKVSVHTTTNVFTHTSTQIHTHINAHKYTHARTHTHTHTHTHTRRPCTTKTWL